MLERRKIIGLILLVVMVLAIPVAVILLRNQQILRSQASTNFIKFGPTGVQVSQSTGQEIAIASTIDIDVVAPIAGVSPTPDTEITVDITNVTQSNDGVTVTFDATPYINVVNLWVDYCEKWVSQTDRTCNSEAQPGYLIQKVVTQRVGNTITIPKDHPFYTNGAHKIGVHPYHCTSTSFQASGCTGGTVASRDFNITNGGAGRIDITNRSPSINVYWISASPITSITSSTDPSNKISNPTFGANQEIYFYFNKNNDVTHVNLKVDGEEAGVVNGVKNQVSFTIDTPCPSGGATPGCFIKWPTNYKRTPGAHTIKIKPYVCPDATTQGCFAPNDGQQFTINLTGATSFNNLPNVLMSLLPQGGLIKEAQAIAGCTDPGDTQIFSCSDIRCPDGSTPPGSGCYPNHYASDCLARCSSSSGAATPTPATATPAPTSSSSLPDCDIRSYSKSVVGSRTCYADASGTIQSTGPTTCKLPADVVVCADLAAGAVATPTTSLPSGGTGGGGGTPGVTSGATVTVAPTFGDLPGMLPIGTSNIKFKISDSDQARDPNSAFWNTGTIKSYDYNTSGNNRVSFTFTKNNCVTSPCDEYPRGIRTVYVLFSGLSGGAEYKVVKAAQIVLALPPKVSSASCELNSTGTGTTVTVKGLHFGDVLGNLKVGTQNATVASSGWNNLQVTGNLSSNLTDTKDVILTTVDGQSSESVACGVGVSKIDFKATLACRTVDKPLSTAEVEIIEDTPQKPSVYKKSAVTFNNEGRPQDIIPDLVEGKAYKFIIKAPNTLAVVKPFIAVKGTTSLEVLNMPLGDIAPDRGDGTINSFDARELKQEWSSTKDTAKRGDLTQDGRINSLDYSCLVGNFNKSSDRP